MSQPAGVRAKGAVRTAGRDELVMASRHQRAAAADIVGYWQGVGAGDTFSRVSSDPSAHGRAPRRGRARQYANSTHDIVSYWQGESAGDAFSRTTSDPSAARPRRLKPIGGAQGRDGTVPWRDGVRPAKRAVSREAPYRDNTVGRFTRTQSADSDGRSHGAVLRAFEVCVCMHMYVCVLCVCACVCVCVCACV